MIMNKALTNKVVLISWDVAEWKVMTPYVMDIDRHRQDGYFTTGISNCYYLLTKIYIVKSSYNKYFTVDFCSLTLKNYDSNYKFNPTL